MTAVYIAQTVLLPDLNGVGYGYVRTAKLIIITNGNCIIDTGPVRFRSET